MWDAREKKKKNEWEYHHPRTPVQQRLLDLRVRIQIVQPRLLLQNAGGERMHLLFELGALCADP